MNRVTRTRRMAGDALTDFGIDISPLSKRRKNPDIERIRMGDKDKRSFLAGEKVRVASEMAGGNYSREELVDMLNQPGVQNGAQFIDALNNDERIRAVGQLDDEGYFVRQEYESPNFVGEGQFGRVTELAPGYVSKEQPALVEWNGYETLEDGSHSPRGKLLPQGGGRIVDYREVQKEVDQLNNLNKKHITPKVENLIINDDGSTEMIMRDLRPNYDTGDDFLNEKSRILNDESLS